jgi:hypothetical protein
MTMLIKQQEAAEFFAQMHPPMMVPGMLDLIAFTNVTAVTLSLLAA